MQSTTAHTKDVIDQLLLPFIAWITKQPTNQGKIASFKIDIENFLTWYYLLPLQQQQFNEVTFNKYRELLMKRQPSAPIANTIIEALKLFGLFLSQSRLIADNPTQLLDYVDSDEEITPKPQESILTLFEQSLTGDSLSPVTIRSYISDCEQFFAWYHQFQNGITSKQISNRSIIAYKKYLQFQLNMAPASIDRKLSALKKFFAWAKNADIFSFNPFTEKMDTIISGVNKLIGTPSLITSNEQRHVSRSQFMIFSVVIILLLLLVIFKSWQPLIPQQQSPQQYPVTVMTNPSQSLTSTFPWIINFKGKLTDLGGLAITDEATVIFSLYEELNATKSVWESREWVITPDQNGQFTAKLGDPDSDDNIINPKLYFEKQSLFLGMETEGNQLQPRTRIPTASNATNSLLLNSYKASLNPKPLEIPIVNQYGEIAFATDSAKIKTIGGNIGLEGEAVTISTPYSSTDNITLAALGGGSIDLISNSIDHNAFNVIDGQLVDGALIAGSITNDFGTASFIDLRSGSIPKTRFKIDSLGNVTITGSITGDSELKFADDRTSSTIYLSEAGYSSLPGSSISLIGAINENYKAASSAASWKDAGEYLKPSASENYIRIYGSSSGSSANYSQLTNSGLTSSSGNFTIDPASTLILDTAAIDLTSLATNIDLINSNSAALTFETQLLRLDTSSTSVEVDGITRLGDGGGTDYLNISDTGDLTFNGSANSITGSSTNGLSISAGTTQTLSLAGDTAITMTTGELEVNSDTINITTQATAISVIDNTSNALSIMQGGDKYLDLDTNDGAESITFGNTTTNPDYYFIGSGNVGIGAASASQKLEVQGEIGLNEYLYFENNTDEYFRWDTSAANFNITNDLLPVTDNLSALGASPSARWKDLFLGPESLHVICTTGDGCGQNLDYSFAVDTSINTFNLKANNTNVLTVAEGGNVGIGIVGAANHKLEVAGDINTTAGGYMDAGGCVAGTCASDLMLKQNIQPVTSALSKIMQLNPVSFQYINPQYGSGTQYGFIAQELEQIFPELVTTASDGYKRVRYGLELQMYAIQAIQEVQQNLTNTLTSHNSITPLDAYGDIIIPSNYVTTNIDQLTVNELESLSFNIKDTAGNIIAGMASFQNIITGVIKSGIINTQNFIADTAIVRQLKVSEKFLSPLVESGQINAQQINLAGHNLHTTLTTIQTQINQFDQQYNQKLEAQQSILAEIINQNASTSAYLKKVTTQSSNSASLLTLGATDSAIAYLNINGDASVSGKLIAQSARFQVLEAEKIKAKNIEGLDNIVHQLLAESESNRSISQTSQIALSKSTSPDNSRSERFPITTPTSNIDDLAIKLQIPQEATNSSTWAITPNLAFDTISSNQFVDAETGLFNTFLGVLGSASIVNLEVTSHLTVDQSMHISNNSISVVNHPLTDTLYLQQNGLGSVDILAGAVIIKDNGDLYVDGSLYLAGDLYIEQNIYSKSLSTQSLKSHTATIGGELHIENLNSKNASIDASGSATFTKLIIATSPNSVNSESTPSSTLLSDSITTNATAGTATIKANLEHITIINPNITPHSLIYITPTSNTKNNVLYISNKIANTINNTGSVTISINSIINRDVTFNWWIIN